MNKDKIIKDLKERNDKLENQRRQFELRLYHEQHLVEEKDKEIQRLNNILNKVNKLLECNTHCENIYYAICVLLKHDYFDIENIDNEEILNILKEGK